MEKGYGIGRLLSYKKLAEAMEDRFSAEVLNWLGYPARTEGRPAPWLQNLLDKQQPDRRTPTLLFLLFVGLLEDSVKGFDDGADQSLPTKGSAHDVALRQGPSLHCDQGSRESGSEWKLRLSGVLAATGYRLRAAAEQLHASVGQVAHQARLQKIRVPLTPQSSSALGPARLSEICTDLKTGIPQAQVVRKHGLNQRLLLMIQLDSPGLYEAHRNAAVMRVRDMNRQNIMELLARNSNSSRDTICMALPGSYRYAMRVDREWFHALVPRQRNPNPHPRLRSDWQNVDRMVASQVQKTIDQLQLLPKPEQITRSAILRCAGVQAKVSRASKLFPSTEIILHQNVESRPEFLKRKIRWAIKEMAQGSVPISVTMLQRLVRIEKKELRTYKQVVVDAARDVGAEIHGRSLFAL
jgi:hypothetical protein